MTISAKVICDSVSPSYIRLMTLQLRYPKFIHSEFMTHRVFSRNASSSRAIPVERLIKDVIDDPVAPAHWGRNQPGMQAHEELQGGLREAAQISWDHARGDAVRRAMELSHLGAHKQIVNRVLEPFCHINVVVTATDWHNFFLLRCHPDAQPEMRELAVAMRTAMIESKPTPVPIGKADEPPLHWHLPYVTQEDRESASKGAIDLLHYSNTLIRVSVARCARVSYLTQEGKLPDISADLQLYDRLVGSQPLHASPAEHQATPDAADQPDRSYRKRHLHGNFKGWVQYRKILERTPA